RVTRIHPAGGRGRIGDLAPGRCAACGRRAWGGRMSTASPGAAGGAGGGRPPQSRPNNAPGGPGGGGGRPTRRPAGPAGGRAAGARASATGHDEREHDPGRPGRQRRVHISYGAPVGTRKPVVVPPVFTG